MEVFKLDFARINILREDIAEVIINSGVELDEDMVDEYHEFLITHLRAPFSLLINKLNPYSYTFGAQQKLGIIEQINAMAAVVYNHTTKLSTNSLATQTRSKPWNFELFLDRDKALAWLEAQQAALTDSGQPR